MRPRYAVAKNGVLMPWKAKIFLAMALSCDKKNGMRTGAGVAQAQQVHVGDHVHFLGVVAVERFSQVENQVGVAA